ncbi:Pre-rRNA-processing protein ipi3 [Xylographa opegraphella]|nr:Pre-rRNA-processing protein ipi3 [Xylographa opegraphella]
MLTESFIASVLDTRKAKTNSTDKDVGIHIYEYQPLSAISTTFKKSTTTPNCLAISISHIFAAQAEKGVIHVYNRDRGNQEAIIPFPEKVTSLALIGRYDGPGILALGTAGGRVLLWELCTGRLVSTPQSHLQAITCLAVDPSFNFFLTASPDASIHVWCITTLLSFSTPSIHDPSRSSPCSPLRTLSTHRAAITALITGHSSSGANIAISASEDNTCLVWDYRAGILLHTFILPNTPLSLAIDPADRAFYAGYDDGSTQLINFYKDPSLAHQIYDPQLRSTPTQPMREDRWFLPADVASPVLSLEISYDGTVLLSGHENGKIHIWDVAKGRYATQLADISSSVTNLRMIPPQGFSLPFASRLQTLNVVKPRYENMLTGSNISSAERGISEAYTITAQFAHGIHLPSATNDPMISFDHVLSHSSLPSYLLDEGRAQLAMFSSATKSPSGSLGWHKDMNVEEPGIATLKARLRHSRVASMAHAEHAVALSDELWRIQGAERRKRRMKKLGRIKRLNMEDGRRKRAMSEVGMAPVGAMEVDKTEAEEAELSSSTEELTGSD